MAKILRVTQKAFASTSSTNQIGVFGSLAAGSPAYTTSAATVQSLSNFLTGWFGAVVGQNSPAIEDLNAICFLYAYQLGYILQAGIAEWDSGTTYYAYSLVNYAGMIYISLLDSNTDNTPGAAPTYWALYDVANLGSGAAASGTSLTADGSGNNAYVQTIPAGIISSYAGASAPSGWLLCDGSSILRSAYPGLFTAIGVAWGAADGTHFNVPDLQGRTAIGAGAGAGLTPRALGTYLGQETHQLTTAELASHNHGITDPGHVHAFALNNAGGLGLATAAGTSGGAIGNTTTGSATTSISVGSTGSGSAHNNMQPSTVCTSIIKT